jgi:hypothetical protein
MPKPRLLPCWVRVGFGRNSKPSSGEESDLSLNMTYHYHGKVVLALVLGLSTSLYLSNFAPFPVIKPSVLDKYIYLILRIRIHLSCLISLLITTTTEAIYLYIVLTKQSLCHSDNRQLLPPVRPCGQQTFTLISQIESIWTF